jgi:hypothetical protein
MLLGRRSECGNPLALLELPKPARQLCHRHHFYNCLLIAFVFTQRTRSRFSDIAYPLDSASRSAAARASSTSP